MTINEQMCVTEDLHKKVDRYRGSRDCCKKVNLSGVELIRFLGERNQAVVRKLMHREYDAVDNELEFRQGSPSAQAHYEHDTHHALAPQAQYPVRYITDNQRIYCDIHIDNAGVTKQSREDRLISATMWTQPCPPRQVWHVGVSLVGTIAISRRISSVRSVTCVISWIVTRFSVSRREWEWKPCLIAIVRIGA